MPITLRDQKQIKFIEELCKAYPQKGANAQANSLFEAIIAASTQNSRERWNRKIVINPDLLLYIASCAIHAHAYKKNVAIPWDSHECDHVLVRTLRNFMDTLREAILDSRVVDIDGKFQHGCFVIPQWFYDECHIALVA